MSTSNHARAVAESQISLLLHENATLLRALGRAQRQASAAVAQLAEQLQHTGQAMQRWRELALQHLPHDHPARLAAAHTVRQGMQAGAACTQGCLAQGQTHRRMMDHGQVWCQQHDAACLLGLEELALPGAPLHENAFCSDPLCHEGGKR